MNFSTQAEQGLVLGVYKPYLALKLNSYIIDIYTKRPVNVSIPVCMLVKSLSREERVDEQRGRGEWVDSQQPNSQITMNLRLKLDLDIEIDLQSQPQLLALSSVLLAFALLFAFLAATCTVVSARFLTLNIPQTATSTVV